MHGLQDIESRYRQRYLDLITNDQSRAVSLNVSLIVREIRRFRRTRGFLEVETPMLNRSLAGRRQSHSRLVRRRLGDLYSRIAPELYLKRLVGRRIQ